MERSPAASPSLGYPRPRERRRAGRGAPIFAAALLLSAPLRAEPPAARLSYARGRGAEGCPGEAVLRGAVAARLGYDPFQKDAPRSIAARVERAGGSLRGVVTLTDAGDRITGTRRLPAANDDCDELVAAMALAISLAIDPEVLLRPPPASRVPPPSAPGAPPPGDRSPLPGAAGTPPAGTPVLEPRPGSVLPPPALLGDPLPAALLPPPPPDRLRFHVAAGAHVAVGAAPAVNGGFTAGVGLRYRVFSARVEGRADVPATKDASAGGSVSAGLFAASLVPCFHARAFAACAIGTMGALRGVGAGVPGAKTEVTPFAALGVRAGVEIPVTGIVSADLHGGLTATLTHTALRLSGRDVWTTPGAAVALGAGALVHFP